MEDFGLGVKTSIYNNELRKRRIALGMEQKDLAKKIGKTNSVISHYETFKNYPDKKAAAKIAKILNCDIETIFPAWLQEYKLKKSSVDREVKIDCISIDSGKAQYLLEGNDDSFIDKTENSLLASKIKEAINALTDREQRILTLRFGLDDSKPHTLEEVGQEFSVTRDRIRQIEAKALAKIRKNKPIAEVLHSFLA